MGVMIWPGVTVKLQPPGHVGVVGGEVQGWRGMERGPGVM